MSSDKFQPTWATKPKPPPADAALADSKPPENGNGNRPMLYRPQRASSPPRPPRRRCLCSCLLFTSLFVVVLLLLAAITAAALYSVYRPHRPTFSLSSLHIAALNFPSAAAFSSNLSLSLSTRNPNSKIAFSYDPFTVSLLSPSSSSSSLQIAAGKLPSFLHPTKNTTHLSSTLTSKGLRITTTQISLLKSSLKRDNTLDLQIRMETKARITVGKSKSKRIAFRVSCSGIRAAAGSKDKLSGTVKTAGVKCKAKLRFKLWKWNLSW